jgi:hypothetical protein
MQPVCARSWAFGLGRPLNVNVSFEMQSNKIQIESVQSEKGEYFSLSYSVVMCKNVIRVSHNVVRCR